MTTATAAGFELSRRPAPLRDTVINVWRSRDLIAMLAKKDFVARYRRAIFGMTWAIGLTVVQALVLAAVLGRVAKINVTVPHYPAFIYTGMVAWSFFSTTFSSASTSVVDGAGLATKIYFPRMVMPFAQIGSNLYAFVPTVLTLIIFAAGFGVPLGLRLLLLIPALLALVVLTAVCALVASSLHVYFRDMRYLVQALLLPWFWASAIFFPLNFIHPGLLRTVIVVNPVSGVVMLFRAAVMGGDPGWTATIPWLLGWIVGLTAFALYMFRRFDRVFVDLL